MRAQLTIKNQPKSMGFSHLISTASLDYYFAVTNAPQTVEHFKNIKM
jgi:protoporphyrinogen oxidase